MIFRHSLKPSRSRSHHHPYNSYSMIYSIVPHYIPFTSHFVIYHGHFLISSNPLSLNISSRQNISYQYLLKRHLPINFTTTSIPSFGTLKTSDPLSIKVRHFYRLSFRNSTVIPRTTLICLVTPI